MGAVRRLVSTGAATFAALVACGSPNATTTTPSPATSTTPEQRIELIEFAAGLGIDLPKFTRTRSGAFYRDVLTGTGASAGTDRTVTIRYVAYLPSGMAVETQATPISFVIGPEVIRGFRDALPGMRVGGMRTLILPPSLAYGKVPYGAVPPNSTLVFEIELLRVR